MTPKKVNQMKKFVEGKPLLAYCITSLGGTVVTLTLYQMKKDGTPPKKPKSMTIDFRNLDLT